MEIEIKSLAQFLKDARASAGLSQKNVSDALGYTTVQFVSNWERGMREPPARVLIELVQLYGIDSETLYEVLLNEKINRARKEVDQIFKNRKA